MYKKLIVIYLLIFSKNSICSDVKGLKNLLQVNSKIEINKNKIIYNSTDIECSIKKKLEDETHRYFQLETSISDDIKLEELTELLRDVRKLIGRNEGQIEVLQDDISFYHSKLAYPLIHGIENLMRKLITLFLIDAVGINNAKDSIPIEIHNSNKNNFLHQTDFIQLGEILTKSYTLENIDNLFKYIHSAESTKDINLDILKGFVPKSNLDRYFKDYIDFDANYLNKKWKRLYELRCKVAHNNFFSILDLNELKSLIQEVKAKLKLAIARIDEIKIPEKDKDRVLQFTISNSNLALATFLTEWKELENKLLKINDTLIGKNSTHVSIRNAIDYEDFIKRHLYNEISSLIIFRNTVVHSMQTNFSEAETTSKILDIRRIKSQFVFKSDYNNSWPFKFDKGVIYNVRLALIIRANGIDYALNGMAKQQGFKSIVEVWLDDPNIPDAKISIGPFINIGKDLLKNNT